LPLLNLKTLNLDGVYIQTITDSLSGPQTQTFTYDELDRLVSSAVTGGSNGIYAEGYTFESGTGNLKTKNGQTYTYDCTAPIKLNTKEAVGYQGFVLTTR
jgi:YD repeat-containing protein